MKFRILTTAILVGAIELVATVRPGLSQTDLNAQLQQALCGQNWGRAIQVVDQMKRVAGRQYAAQLTLYQGQLEVFARENVRIASGIEGCANTSSPTVSAPINPNNNPGISGSGTPYNRGYAPSPR